jgi:hypothetical protein
MTWRNAMPNSQPAASLLLPGLSRRSSFEAQSCGGEAQWSTRWSANLEKGRKIVNSEDRKLRDSLVVPLEEAARLTKALLGSVGDGENDRETTAPRKVESRTGRNPRGVFQKILGKNSPWWIRYIDAQGRFRREKAGTKGAAIGLYRKRKNEALVGKKLPEKLRRATVTFAEIATDALGYSKQHKRDYRHDAGRMETLLAWFREYPADGITAKDIERRFEQQAWSPATCNRFRALLSLTYRLAIRSGKVKENPARLVPHRLEDNARIRFLSAEEEIKLRTAIAGACPEQLPELELALNTGLRMSEQYGLRWQDVSLIRRTLTQERRNTARPPQSGRCARPRDPASQGKRLRVGLWRN